MSLTSGDHESDSTITSETENSSFEIHINSTGIQQAEEETLKRMKNKKEDDDNINITKNKKARKEGLNFTCEICTESKPIEKMFKNESSSTIIKCSTIHDPFCLDCIANHIIAKLEENIANVKCPSLICDQMIDPLLCDKIIPNDLFKKWCDLLCHEALVGYKKCLCPNKECLELVVDECGDSNNIRKFGCPSCKKLLCFNCKVAWHECKEEEEDEEEVDEKLFLKLVNDKKWSKCPGCNYYVERNDGCNHIYCRCRESFCYDCGERLQQYGHCKCTKQNS